MLNVGQNPSDGDHLRLVMAKEVGKGNG